MSMEDTIRNRINGETQIAYLKPDLLIILIAVGGSKSICVTSVWAVELWSCPTVTKTVCFGALIPDICQLNVKDATNDASYRYDTQRERKARAGS